MSQLSKREEVWLAALTAAIAADKEDPLFYAGKCLWYYDKIFLEEPLPKAKEGKCSDGSIKYLGYGFEWV